MTSQRRRALAVVALGALALTGCTGGAQDDVPHDAPSGGQTLEEMQVSLDSLPGIHVSEIAGGGRPNAKGSTGYAVALEVEPGYTVSDGAALVDFVVTSVWSVREGYRPNARVDVSVRTPADEGFDVAAAAAEAGWAKDTASAPGAYGTVPVEVSASSRQGARNLERLGSWPGAVPEVPEGVTTAE